LYFLSLPYPMQTVHSLGNCDCINNEVSWAKFFTGEDLVKAAGLTN